MLFELKKQLGCSWLYLDTSMFYRQFRRAWARYYISNFESSKYILLRHCTKLMLFNIGFFTLSYITDVCVFFLKRGRQAVSQCATLQSGRLAAIS